MKDGKFENDQARAAFDAKMDEAAALDVQIRAARGRSKARAGVKSRRNAPADRQRRAHRVTSIRRPYASPVSSPRLMTWSSVASRSMRPRGNLHQDGRAVEGEPDERHVAKSAKTRTTSSSAAR
jgi:hypothetical protein